MNDTRKAGIVVSVIMFAIVVAGLYAIIYAAPRLEGIGIKTETVQYEELPIADTVTALFVRDETLYTAAYSGVPDYMVAAGTKVRAGTQVMYITPSEGPAAAQATQTAYIENAANATDTSATSAQGGDNQETAMQTLLRVAGPDAVVSEGGVTPKTAIVSYYGDGWEKKVTPDNIMTLDKSIMAQAPKEALDLTSGFVQAGDPVYRITNNNLWRVAFWIENADKTVLDKYKVGRGVTIDLGTTKVTATVESATPEGRDVFVVLQSDMYYKDLDKYRTRDISVVFSEVSGAVISKQTVKLKAGQPGVYVKQQSGTFKWVPVKVLKESGDRFLVAETYFNDAGGNYVTTIRYYDEIMSNPAAEGY